jgi:Holliday junction resolvasome RuvABC endonuclease subunit
MAMFDSNLRYGLVARGVTVVGYELVKPNQQRSKLAAASYGRYEGILWVVCNNLYLPLVSFTPYEVKKAAAGFVQAEKDDMEALAFKRWNVMVKTHDEADALFIADLTRAQAK